MLNFQSECIIRTSLTLVIVFLTALAVGIPFDLVSLYLTFVQAFIAVMTYVNIGRKYDIASIFFVLFFGGG